ncbi:MAG: acyltransferase [Actinomycetota bacterium]|nr:acyltransferase [Actinomycetota bacterium]
MAAASVAAAPPTQSPPIATATARGPAPPPRPFRPDIEGLRAVAVVLVVAFHAGFPAITGGYVGVDVFYVISGFLITGLLFDEVERTGSIDFASFYARRARRLLPMAMLVLMAVAVGMLFFTPPVFRPQVRFDAISAALYYSNWQFALESVNYLTLGAAQNPVLHYWSLSVEEQFYLFWPLLLLVAVRLGRRGAGAGRRIRWGAVVAVVGGCSLAYSLVATPAQPATAYFATTTRVWEFAIGAGVALLAPSLPRAPRIVAISLGVVGLATVITSALAYSPTTEFPGSAAIAPVLGAAAVIAAGFAVPLGGVGALLTLPPLRYVGRISYALYLWHWPCLVFAATSRWAPPDGRIGWFATTVAVALAFALAATTHALVEVPMRHAAWLAASGRRVLLLAGAATAAAILAVGIAGGPLSLSQTSSGLLGDTNASVIAPTAVTPLDAQASTPYAALHGCHVGYSATAPASACAFGDIGARRTVVLLGDSHAAQWFPALAELAVREHVRLISWTKSGCPFTLGVHIFLPAIGRDYSECLAWQTAVVRKLRTMPRPAMIIVGRTSTYLPQVLTADGEKPASAQAGRLWGAGMRKSVTVLRHLTGRVVVLRDTPHAPFDVPACISWDPDTASRCNFPRAADGHSDDAEYSVERKAGVPRDVYANPTPAVCPTAVCPAVFAGEITYRDDNHLTAKFVSLRWRQFAASLHGSFARRQI